MEFLFWDYSIKNIFGGSDILLCYSWYVLVDFLFLYYYKFIFKFFMFYFFVLVFNFSSYLVFFDFIVNSIKCVKFYYYIIWIIYNINVREINLWMNV